MNETQHKALMLLGLARKARKLEIGEEPCGIACRSGKAESCFSSRHDRRGTTRSAGQDRIAARESPHNLRRCRLRRTVIRRRPRLQCGCGAVRADGRAVCESKFWKIFRNSLHSTRIFCRELTRQTERVNKRRQEEKAHRKNVRFGKK